MVVKDSRRGEEAPASHTSPLGREGTQRKKSDARYRGRRGRTERPRDGLSAVLADHRTEEGGKKRPIGKPCFEDKIVQRAVVMILEAIFDQDVQECSHGFRKGHSPHQALHALREQCRKLNINWIVDADVSGFFDTIPHRRLIKAVKKRVADRDIRDLLWKFLRAGVMHQGTTKATLSGTPQGGIVTLPTKLLTFW